MTDKDIQIIIESISELLLTSDGKLCPSILTEAELISLLRLEPATGARTLRHYRAIKLLEGFRCGKHFRYYKPKVIQFLNRLANVGVK